MDKYITYSAQAKFKDYQCWGNTSCYTRGNIWLNLPRNGVSCASQMEARAHDRDLINEFPLPKSRKTDSWWAYKCGKLQRDVRKWSLPLSSAVCHISQSQCFDWHVLHVKCFLGVSFLCRWKTWIFIMVCLFLSAINYLYALYAFSLLFRLNHFIECILIYILVLYSYRHLLCLPNHLSIRLLISLHLKSHSCTCVSFKNTRTEKNNIYIYI